eukprot:maker-scaffold92_size382268-snap-gene-0.11 protein:Tk08741 transcript:maker-scaffold92_size382268-snap-gene-0.11-mRNA-1 annotation:"protein sprouty-like"
MMVAECVAVRGVGSEKKGRVSDLDEQLCGGHYVATTPNLETFANPTLQLSPRCARLLSGGPVSPRPRMQDDPPPPPPRASAIPPPQPVGRSTASSTSPLREQTHAHVQLPIRPTNPPRARTSPGLALRLSETPPIPPPRPENTFSSHTRDITVPVRASGSTAARPPQSSGPSRSPATIHPTSTPLLGITSIPPPPPQLLGLLSQANSISLTTPRPGLERNENLYVETPLKPTASPGTSQFGRDASLDALPLPWSTNAGSGKPKRTLSSKGPGSVRRELASPNIPSSVILSSSTLKNNPLTEKNLSEFQRRDGIGPLSSSPSACSPLNEDIEASESIICSDCGRCRCISCRTARSLPEKWLCSNKCHVSAETVVDTLSCMWLVKGVLYHCGKDIAEGEDSCENAVIEDNPCSCTGETAVARWACIGATSLVLPCLCCYMPLKGCAKGAETLYQHATSNGCQCRERPAQPIKREPAFLSHPIGLGFSHKPIGTAPNHMSESLSHLSSANSTIVSPASSPGGSGSMDSVKKSLLS